MRVPFFNLELDPRFWITVSDLPAPELAGEAPDTKSNAASMRYCSEGSFGISTPATTFFAICSPVFLSVSTSM